MAHTARSWMYITRPWTLMQREVSDHSPTPFIIQPDQDAQQYRQSLIQKVP